MKTRVLYTCLLPLFRVAEYAFNRGRTMEIRHERRGAVTIIGLRGRWVYDPSLRTELRDHVRRFIEAGQLDVVLDLGGVSFVDSAVVGEIASTHIALKRRGGRLALLNPTEQMSRLLAISRLESVIEIQRPCP